MRQLLKRRSFLMAPALMPVLSHYAAAQTWRPAQPVRIIVAAAPGGTLDIHARAAQSFLSTYFGQSLIVENQGGGCWAGCKPNSRSRTSRWSDAHGRFRRRACIARHSGWVTTWKARVKVKTSHHDHNGSAAFMHPSQIRHAQHQ